MNESKSVAQIACEWNAIEAKRPGGSLPNVVETLRRGREAERPKAEQALLDVIDILHETIKGYHVEMGIVLSETPVLPVSPNAELEAYWKAGFLRGAKWWDYHTVQATMWQSEQNECWVASHELWPSVRPEMIQDAREICRLNALPPDQNQKNP